MKNKDLDKKKKLILQCRYYNGEDNEPEGLSNEVKMFWFYEKCWVECSLKGGSSVDQFYKDIEFLHLETKSGDKTPLTLKALLCNRYLHWNGCNSLDVELKYFEKWYIEGYLKRKTNREQRADQRKTELIVKCRFYHGEEICCFEDHAIQCFWNWEKQWVEVLADSYLNRDKIKTECITSKETYPLRVNGIDKYMSMAEKKHIPKTLMMLFMIEFAKGYKGGFKHEMEEYFDFWLSSYLKQG